VGIDRVILDVGTGVDVAGVAVIVLGAVVATLMFARALARRVQSAYPTYREGLGRAILLGLELLVAGDIIRTVAVRPSFSSVGVLAIIVAIRTFLSFTLELEIGGRWPWQARRRDGKQILGQPPES